MPKSVAPFILVSLTVAIGVLIIQAQVRGSISSRLDILIEDRGSAQVTSGGPGMKGGYFNYYPTSGSPGEILLLNPLGSGTGVFDLFAWAQFSSSTELTWINIEAEMLTTFQFNFLAPSSPLPPGVQPPQSIGFIAFDEARARAVATSARPGGYAYSSSRVATNLTSAAAEKESREGTLEDNDPEAGYRRVAVEMSLDISSGVANHWVNFSGNVYADPRYGSGQAFATGRTGVVVPSSPDPLGIPEVGDNEYVWFELYPPPEFPPNPAPDPVGAMLLIPSHATVIGGDNDTLEYFRPTLDWSVSNPGLPAASRLENGSDTTSRTVYAVSSITNPYENFPNNIETWNKLVFGDYWTV